MRKPGRGQNRNFRAVSETETAGAYPLGVSDSQLQTPCQSTLILAGSLAASDFPHHQPPAWGIGRGGVATPGVRMNSATTFAKVSSRYPTAQNGENGRVLSVAGWGIRPAPFINACPGLAVTGLSPTPGAGSGRVLKEEA